MLTDLERQQLNQFYVPLGFKIVDVPCKEFREHAETQDFRFGMLTAALGGQPSMNSTSTIIAVRKYPAKLKEFLAWVGGDYAKLSTHVALTSQFVLRVKTKIRGSYYGCNILELRDFYGTVSTDSFLPELIEQIERTDLRIRGLMDLCNYKEWLEVAESDVGSTLLDI